MKNKDIEKTKDIKTKDNKVECNKKSCSFDIYSTLKTNNKLYCCNCKELLTIPFKKKVIEVVCKKCKYTINLKELRKNNNNIKNFKKKYHWLIRFLKYIKKG